MRDVEWWKNRPFTPLASEFNMPIDEQKETDREPGMPSQAPLADAVPAAVPSAGTADASLGNAERLVAAAIANEDELENAGWQLTLSQWNLGRREIPARQWTRQSAMMIASAATVVYLTYRLIWTLNLANGWAAAFSLLLFCAEAYAGMSLALYFFQVWRLVEPPLRRPTERRTVDVFVATYNEDVSLLRGTLNACLQMDYPHVTYVLDDGARDEVRQLAESLGVRYISRPDRTHAKAGNLNHALLQTDGEFVVILDADHIPYRHYISRLIGYFDDPRMGFVQVPHTTYNLDNFMGRWRSVSKAYWEDVRIFFEAVQLGKNRYGVACFCGSAAIFRRKAIEDVGLFATETITEDMHTGMRINAAGWKSIAVSEEMVVGLAPDDAVTFTNQRLRWGEGNLSVLAYDNPLTMKGLTLAGRINYLASILSWTMGPARLILYLTPLVMLLSGVAPVSDLSITYIAVVVGYLVAVWAAVKIASNGCGQLLGIEMAMMASFHLQLQALWRALFRRRLQKFVVTTKRPAVPKRFSGIRRMWPQAALVAMSVVAVAWASARTAFGLSDDYFGLLVGSGLAAYHSWLALTVLARATASRDPLEQWHHPLCLSVEHSIAGENKPGVSIELNENACRLLSWDKLEPGWPLRIAFHTPVGEAISHGEVVAVAPLGGRQPFGYLCSVVFDHANPAKRTQESDSLRSIIVRYITPVVTMTHRLVHQGQRALPEELSGEGDFPIPVAIDTNQSNLAIQKSVAISIDHRGFLAALGTSCPIGSLVEAVLHTPFGPLSAALKVADVETMRVGAAIVHQHEFQWCDPAAVRAMVDKTRHWRRTLTPAVSHLRNHRQSLANVMTPFLAACALIVVTFFAFREINAVDIFLAANAGRAMTSEGRGELQGKLEQQTELSKTSTERLLRIYEAANTLGDHSLAADAAAHLADREPAKRFDWLLTQARQLAKTEQHPLTAAAFDQLLAAPMKHNLSMDQQADIYVEAARAAVNVADYETAVDRFLQANNLRATNPEEAEELLGVLITARKTQLAIQVLRQLEPTDRVLRRIVDVYEMAHQGEKAVPELEELHRRDPDDAFVARRLAELAVDRREFAQGVGYYRELSRLEPENERAKEKLAEAYILLARENVAAERYAEANRLFDESFRIQPADDKVKCEYAASLAKAGRFDEALAILEPLRGPDVSLQLASVLEMQGNAKRALQTLLDLRQSEGVDRKTERSIARLLLANHDYEEAARQTMALMQDEPADPELHREFLDAVAASPRFDNAMRKELLRLYRHWDETGFRSLDAQGFERLSETLRRFDMYDEARHALDAAVAQFPANRRLRFYLAQALGSLGRYDDAEAQYQVLLTQ